MYRTLNALMWIAISAALIAALVANVCAWTMVPCWEQYALCGFVVAVIAFMHIGVIAWIDTAYKEEIYS